MSSYVMWRLDPTLSPARSLPPVRAHEATAQLALARAHREDDEPAEGRGAGGS